MVLLCSIPFIFCEICVIVAICVELRLLQYLFIIDNENAIFNWVIIIAYIKDPTANKYQSIVSKKVW